MPKPLDEVSFCYLGDARFNMADTYIIGGAKVGMDVRICSPKSLWPRKEIVDSANKIVESTGGRITLTESVEEAVLGCDVLATDVWVSMGEADEVWAERIKLLLPYQVNAKTMSLTGNPDVKFMHCLPAFHNSDTQVGQEILEKYRPRVARGDRGGLRVPRVDRLRRGGEPDAHDQGGHGRHPRELNVRIVVALGGNALLKRGEPLTAENQRANARIACRALAPLARENELVVSHGNGPQVGSLRSRVPRTRRSRRTRSTCSTPRPKA